MHDSDRSRPETTQQSDENCSAWPWADMKCGSTPIQIRNRRFFNPLRSRDAPTLKMNNVLEGGNWEFARPARNVSLLVLLFTSPVFTSLLSIPLARQCFLHAALFAGFQVVGVTLTSLMMSSGWTFRLNRRRAFSRGSPSCTRTSAKEIHSQPAPMRACSRLQQFRRRG